MRFAAVVRFAGGKARTSFCQQKEPGRRCGKKTLGLRDWGVGGREI
jgi:hypothetical protein